MVGDKEGVEKEEFYKDFLQYVEINENFLASVKLSDPEILKKYLSLQILSQLVFEDEDSDINEKARPSINCC